MLQCCNVEFLTAPESTKFDVTDNFIFLLCIIMSRLFVGNVPFRVSPEELRAEFEAVAPVNDFFWPMDRETGRKKGFCFVDVADEDMEKVIEAMHGKEVGGRELAVNEARPREEA